jgi:3-oxoacyl-[acyl-carrier protein] reductase
MTHQLQNKRALVTGGSRGIGAAIVKRLAREGADIALTYVSKPDQADETAKAALGVQAIAIQADNADAGATVAAVEQTVRELRGVDILVRTRKAGRTIRKCS